MGVDGQRQRWRRRIVVFRIRTCNHVAAMRYVLIMSTATESLSDDQDVRELVEAIDAGEIGTGLVGGAGDGAGREIAPICRRDPRTRPTIVVRNKDMEQFYFEAGSEGRIWLPWEILPERASQRLVRLVSESGRKNIYYERCDEAQIAMPPGLTQEVTEGGLFQWAGGSRRNGDTFVIDVRPASRDLGERPGAFCRLRTMLNPWVLELDTMHPIGQKHLNALNKVIRHGDWDLHPEFQVEDWLRVRLHSGLARSWRTRTEPSSTMLTLLLGPKRARPWEVARAFPIVDSHRGTFRVSIRDGRFADYLWSGGVAARGDLLVGHATEVLGLAWKQSNPDATPPPLRHENPRALFDSEDERLDTLLDTCMSEVSPALRRRAASACRITRSEHTVLRHELRKGRAHAQSTLEYWCSQYLVPRSAIDVQMPPAPEWFDDARGTPDWNSEATFDPAGGGRRDLPRARVAVWWLRLLDPGARLKKKATLTAEDPGWKSAFLVWLFRGAGTVPPGWAERTSLPRGGELSRGRLGEELVLGGGTTGGRPSVPDDLDWPTVLET